MQEIMVRGSRLAARGSIPNGVSHASDALETENIMIMHGRPHRTHN